MNTIDLIKAHTSIRSFENFEIPSEDLQEIIECGIRTSSAGNMMAWSVIATQDKENLKKMAQLQNDQKFVVDGSVHLTFCADYYRIKKWLDANQAQNSFDNLCGFMTGVVDAAIVAQNCALAAEAKGYGICYLGTTLWNATKISEFLDLPELVVPVTSFIIGKPANKPERIPRLKSQAVLHFEKYNHFSIGEIKEIYHHLDVVRTNELKQNPKSRERMIELGVENLAQFYVSEAKYSKKLFLEISNNHLNLLKAKGFLNHTEQMK